MLVGLFHMLRSVPLFGATAWWAFYAERERGFTSAQIAFFIICAYGLGCVGYYVCGRSMERWGRKPTAFVYSLGATVFLVLLFQVTSRPLSFVSLGLGVFFGLGMAPVMSAYSTELFPTEIRGQAAAWTRNLFDIAGYVFGPALVGILGDHATGCRGQHRRHRLAAGAAHAPDVVADRQVPPGDQGPRARADRRRDLRAIGHRGRRSVIGAASASSVTETSDPEMTALRRSFRLGGLAVVAAIVAIGGIIAAFGTPADRPAGVAERWLVALSDTTRDGLEDDAIERMEELTIPLEGGSARFLEPDAVGLDSLFVAFPTLADDRGAAADGEGRFETVQVGRADTLDDLVRDGHALVPVQVTPYEADDPVDGYVQLQDTDDGWRVGAAVARGAGRRRVRRSPRPSATRKAASASRSSGRSGHRSGSGSARSSSAP